MMRKGIISWVALSVCLVMLVQGCTYLEELQFYTQEEPAEGNNIADGIKEEIIERDASGSGGSGENDSEDGTRQYEPEQPAEAAGSEELPIVSGLYYAYHKLDTEQQKIYLEMLDALTDLKTGAELSTVDKSGLDVIFACVMNDHPELFYVEGYQVMEYTLGSKTVNITFSGTYSMTAEEARQTRTQIEQRLDECFHEVPLNEDEYSTVLFLYEWLINNTEYDKTAENNQDIRSVFLNGRSVCQGYAKAMQYMLQKAGIQCLLVTGFTNGERHAWNLTQVDGDFYYLDPTWGDASYSSASTDSATGGFEPSINYDYFLVTTDEITRTHAIEKAVELPLCLAIDDNYFVREGLYFDSYDEERLASVLGGGNAGTDGYVTIKCGSSECYDMMVQELIGSQKIFDFVDKQGAGIAYTVNDNLRTMSFWDMPGGEGTAWE